MIKTQTQTFCDFCGNEFTSSYWDHSPCKITLSYGHPAQAFESRSAEHVCKPCRQKLGEYWQSLILKDPAQDKKE